MMHDIKSLVDILQRKVVSDEFINLDLSIHVVLNKARQLGTSLHATECRAAPDTSSHKLEGTSLDLLSSSRNTDDNGLTPAFVARLRIKEGSIV